MNRRNLLRYGIAIATGAVIALLVMSAKGIFTLTDGRETMRILSDSCFVAGVCLASAGLILFVSNVGLFDIFGFSMRLLFGALKRNVRDRKYKDFYEYREAKKEKKHSVAYLLIVGLFFIAASACFLLLFHNR